MAVQIKINEDEYELTRPRLKKWLEIQDLQNKFSEAADKQDHEKVAELIISIISVALSISDDVLSKVPWYEIANAFSKILSICTPKQDFPILLSEIKTKKDAWDYDGRTWYLWVNIFARRYGWTLEVISELDFDDAIALTQEISIDEQLHREWEWVTSEVAYYAKDGFKPLERPDWMKYSKMQNEIPTLKIRKDLMPSGIIIRDSSSSNN